jgi:two-component system phosphate regulon response regulator PhoB
MVELRQIGIVHTRGDLVAAVEQLEPAFSVHEIGADGFLHAPQTAVWCFVERFEGSPQTWALCRALRNGVRGSEHRITAVIDATDTEANDNAMRAGADDCMVGPLRPAELVRRIRNQKQQEPMQASPSVIEVDKYHVDLRTRTVKWNGRPIALRASEFVLLHGLLNSANRLLALEEIVKLAGYAPDQVRDRSVNVWIGRLRRSLQNQGVPDHIRTVRSLGYVFDVTSER